MDEHEFDERGMTNLEVLGIRVLGGEDTPVLLLKEEEGSRILPIWIGHVEAAAIALQLSEDPGISRPLAHDLLAEVLHAFVGEATGRIVISGVVEGVFEAHLRVLDLDIDARPSDGVVLALKLGWAIQCPKTLMDQVGVEVEELPNDEVDEFRAFLDSVNADDFSSEDDT